MVSHAMTQFHATISIVFFYRAPAANAPDVLQPVGLLYHPVLDTPTFNTRRPHVLNDTRDP
jgi:hypothetical protein